MQLQLTTSDVPAIDRADYLRSAMQRALRVDCHVKPRCPQSFAASIGVMPAGPVELIEVSGNAYRTERDGPGAEGRVSVLFQFEGNAVVDDGRHTARLMPGDACVFPPERGVALERCGVFRQAFINVTTDEMDARVPHWRELTTLRLESSRPRLRQAADLFRLMLDHRGDLGPGCRGRLAGTGLALLGGLLADLHGPRAAVPAPRYSRLTAYHRQRIERFIAENLRDPELTVVKIAGALGLSVRYVHKLFENGPPVMQWVSAQRLRACQQDIATRGSRSISEVAYAWGFNSPSHFSRAFKKHHGVRPSDA